MKRVLFLLFIIICIVVVFLLIEIAKVNTYKSQLDVIEHDIYYKYELLHQIDSLQKELKRYEYNLEITNEECAKLRKSNINYRLKQKRYE